MKYLRYLKYLLIHKYYVGVECFKCGLYWRGITHDLSKFLPSEFIPYAINFYGTKAEIKKNKLKYNYAWLLHQKRNQHHWQYWILKNDYEKDQCFYIPYNILREMYCDWVGAGLAIHGKNNIKEWYKKTQEYRILHPLSEAIIEGWIYNNWEEV